MALTTAAGIVVPSDCEIRDQHLRIADRDLLLLGDDPGPVGLRFVESVTTVRTGVVLHANMSVDHWVLAHSADDAHQIVAASTDRPTEIVTVVTSDALATIVGTPELTLMALTIDEDLVLLKVRRRQETDSPGNTGLGALLAVWTASCRTLEEKDKTIDALRTELISSINAIATLRVRFDNANRELTALRARHDDLSVKHAKVMRSRTVRAAARLRKLVRGAKRSGGKQS